MFKTAKSKAPITFLFLVLAFLLCAVGARGEIPASIHKLKRLYLNTVIVEREKPGAVIVAPSDDKYRRSVDLIQDRIFELKGVRLSVITDSAAPKTILGSYNVIALGNLVTNRFIAKLYEQWYCLLDPKYPGEGGYVVRSLHNPYGTGHNVILIGGSDQQGVFKAAKVFANLFKRGEPLKVGWIMRIRLGKTAHPPRNRWPIGQLACLQLER